MIQFLTTSITQTHPGVVITFVDAVFTVSAIVPCVKLQDLSVPKPREIQKHPRAVTNVFTDFVLTGGTVLAGVRDTLVDVCGTVGPSVALKIT